MMSLGSSSILFAIIFTQFAIVPSWLTVLQWLAIASICSILVFIQKILVLNLAQEFHLTAYKERVQESKRQLEMLDKLRKAIRTSLFTFLDMDLHSTTSSKPPELDDDRPRQSPRKRSIFDIFFKRGKAEDDVELDILNDATVELTLPQNQERSVHFYRQKTQSAINIDRKESQKSLPRKSTSRSIRKVPEKSLLKSTTRPSVEAKEDSKGIDKRKRDKLEITVGKQALSGNEANILSDKSGHRLAKKLYKALSKNGAESITLFSFYRFFPSEREAMDAFEVFDNDHDGVLGHDELMNGILRMYRERESLVKSLNDLSQAIGQLNTLLYIITGILTLFISLPVFGISLTAVLPFTSILVLFSFVFGSAAGSTFNCIIFLFQHHPFDVGDKIMVDDKTYLVEELHLLTSVLQRTDGQRIYAPNCKWG
jgi:hypothetical protein